MLHGMPVFAGQPQMMPRLPISATRPARPVTRAPQAPPAAVPPAPDLRPKFRMVNAGETPPTQSAKLTLPLPEQLGIATLPPAPPSSPVPMSPPENAPSIDWNVAKQ